MSALSHDPLWPRAGGWPAPAEGDRMDAVLFGAPAHRTSLSPTGAMALDLALVLARTSAFEYVLVHELCHLIHHDHSRPFWREVERRCPDWRDERDYFQAEGRRLKTAMRMLCG